MNRPVNILRPQTRINDKFVYDKRINASPQLSSTRHPLITGEPADEDTLYKAEFYKYIACDIVVETAFDYPYPYLTEKTLRPIACKRMIIVLGAVGILDLLHQKGFETFDDIIDESYDKIKNPTERFLAVVAQAKKICNTPLSDLKNYIQTNSKKFDNNFENLKKLEDRELQNIAKQFNIKL